MFAYHSYLVYKGTESELYSSYSLKTDKTHSFGRFPIDKRSNGTEKPT